MTRPRSVLIAYEDKYFDQLHLLVKRIRRERSGVPVILEGRSVKGTGGFIGEVPRLLRTPLSQTKMPPDLVVCVADADRPANLLPGGPTQIGGADRAALADELHQFEVRWRQHLLDKCRVEEVDHPRLQVGCLLWNKESLLIAATDALDQYAKYHGRGAEWGAALLACEPLPTAVDDHEYGAVFRRPDYCMNLFAEVVEGRNYKKGLHDEDLLRAYILPNPAALAQVLARCPDLPRLVDHLG